ncbi:MULTISPECIES: LysR family transcriptional regulator [Ralstonia solanacearum species complex]|uniref:LysR family transcriptional regulator n=1 Tax=Ralstonia solanacearum species complex TaxID=3116862 RepID=UPI000E5946A3|nr:LysR family transcriptional regulator [Ralstonia solanacearum]BEU74936.1 LysR family transcriptional regulator [Ralstonia pseudosolanacearum]AXV79739.1 LysR family transcriptional regulator [Ralstonia solanacearum]AXV93767.1 LysR family transcriptional regulator [Ralstonia solanacearum]AXW21763.1 LysR family transcriptional regulator [Ralstonia solanacearum]AXW78661.1 LysR family transcriptional regulator [Ralstonia solanacearum]
MLRTGLSELTAFIAIAEQRSFRAAAKKLGVSAPALSHAVKNLEASLNVRLFNRTTRSVALTEAGEHLLRRVGPALADLEDGINEVASAGTRPAGSIRISAAEAGARPLVRHVLPDFLAAYPDIHVEIVVDTRLVDIVAEGFDAGIRVLGDVPQDMIAVEFGPAFRFAAVASPDYLSRHEPPKTPQDLRQHRCIRFRFLSGALYRWELERRGSSASIDVDGPMTLGNTNLMVDAALAGIGIAWVPEYLVVEHLAAGRLVHLLPDWSPSLPGLCLYYPANRHPPAALRLFSQAVREWASSESPQSPSGMVDT